MYFSMGASLGDPVTYIHPVSIAGNNEDGTASTVR